MEGNQCKLGTNETIEERYESYVSRYAISNKISIEEARTHKMVSEYRKYLEEEFSNRKVESKCQTQS